MYVGVCVLHSTKKVCIRSRHSPHSDGTRQRVAAVKHGVIAAGTGANVKNMGGLRGRMRDMTWRSGLLSCPCRRRLCSL